MNQIQNTPPSLSLTLGPNHAILRPVEVPLKRFGVGRDGGYVGPHESITDGDLILSFGLSYEWSFEEAIAASASNVYYVSFDPTVSFLHFFNEFQIRLWEIFHFSGDATLIRRIRVACHKAIVLKNYVRDFILGNNEHIPKWVKGDCSDCPNCMTIAEIFAQYAAHQNLVLKIDIEGDEFGLLEVLIRNGDVSRVRSFFIEFHDLDRNWKRFCELVKQLRDTHVVAHLHLSNMRTDLTEQGIPRFLEMTFVRKGELPTVSKLRDVLPLPGVDYPNRPERPDFSVQFVE